MLISIFLGNTIECNAPVGKRSSPCGLAHVYLLCWFTSILVFQSLSFAQSATSSLRGTITDAKGLVIAGANITLSNTSTGFSRTTKTDEQGVYQFLEFLPPPMC